MGPTIRPSLSSKARCQSRYDNPRLVYLSWQNYMILTNFAYFSQRRMRTFQYKLIQPSSLVLTIRSALIYAFVSSAHSSFTIRFCRAFMTTSIDHLPFDILFQIASSLHLDDVVHLGHSCGQLQALLSEWTLCRRVVEVWSTCSRRT